VPIAILIESELLGRRVFGDLPFPAFEAKYVDEVSEDPYELDVAMSGDSRRCKMFELWSVPRGYYVVKDRTAKFSLYESRERTDYSTHLSSWASFSRGTWVPSAPATPGIYPVRDKQGARRPDREVKEVGDRIVDVSGGYVPPDRVSVWVGEWWSEPYPPLPGAV
jgi:hypothetical protein